MTDTFHANFFGCPDYGNQSKSTGYVSPVKDVALGAHDEYEFTFHLVLGDIAAIRSYAYQVAGHGA